MAEPKNNSGRAAVLQTLASSGEKWIQLGTLALVGLSGGGNLFATHQAERTNEAELARAVNQIREFQRANETKLERSFAETHALHEAVRDQGRALLGKVDDLNRKLDAHIQQPHP